MNLLIIFTDQQHHRALGRIDPMYMTPNLDRLADEGVLFTHAYSNNPLCGPFRGCLMTGLLTSHCGLKANNMPLPPDKPTLAGQLRARGWQTGFVGKWHLGGRGAESIPEEKRGGFERFTGYQMYNGFDPAEPYCNRVAFFDDDNVEHVYREHRTEVTTRLATRMLRDMAKDTRPFCLVVGYQAPHYPEQPLPAYEQLYRDVVFPVDAQGMNVEPYTPTFNPPSPADRSLCPDYRRYGGNMAEYKRLYAAMVSQVDHGVGVLLQTLKDTGHWEDTLVVFTSDHGDMQGSHGLVNKGVPYEMSAGIPMLVRCPGGAKGVRSDALVQGVDIFATAMALAGADNPGDGRSLLPIVQGDGRGEIHSFVVSESFQGSAPWKMIRTARYKLVVSAEDHTPRLLFDMEKDPDEQCNLLQTGRDWQDVINPMLQALKDAVS